MQFSRYLTYSKSDSSYRFLPWLIKGGLAFASFYYVVTKLLAEKVFVAEMLSYFTQPLFSFVLLIVVVLMLVNWWLETKKWQIVASPFRVLPLNKAFKAVIAGVSLDTILPLGTGAVAGKVLSLKGVNRGDLFLPVVLAQGLQSFWTVALGSIGLYQLAQMTDLGMLYEMEGWKIAGFLVIGLAVFVFVRLWPKGKGLLKQYSFKNWVSLLLLSFVRYMVFLFQLLVLSSFMSTDIPMMVLLGCSTWMFFAKTIVPKPGHLGSLGIRGAAVIFFLNQAGYPYTGFVLATFVLWVINLAVPSLIGLFFIKELHLSADNK